MPYKDVFFIVLLRGLRPYQLFAAINNKSIK